MLVKQLQHVVKLTKNRQRITTKGAEIPEESSIINMAPRSIFLTLPQYVFHHVLLVIGLSFVLHVTSSFSGADKIDDLAEIQMDIADDGSCSYVLKMPPCGQCNVSYFTSCYYFVVKKQYKNTLSKRKIKLIELIPTNEVKYPKYHQACFNSTIVVKQCFICGHWTNHDQ